MIRNMQELLKAAQAGRVAALAVAAAQDRDVLESVAMARRAGIAEPVLIGDEPAIRAMAEEIGLEGAAVIHEPDKALACMKAAALVRDGGADLIMKGFTETSVMLRAVLARENGLRRGGLVTHDLVLEIPGFERLLHVTDSAMTIAPTLEDKAAIIGNAVSVAHALGNAEPKVAVLCAVERPSERMPCTLDALALTEMNRRGEIAGCVVEGPLALDNAVSAAAAAHKGIAGRVPGQADILVVPSIEAGNILGKSAEYFAGAKKAGVIVGAGAPVALTSRASSAESKLYTIALACLIAGRGERNC